MAIISQYGSLWGAIPNTAGRVFWVAPSASYTIAGDSFVASDGNGGLVPTEAFLTLDYAIGKCIANVGDVIVLLPGAHSWSASVAADVAGVTITGLPGGKGNPWRHKTSITTSADDEVINVTAANVEIAYLHVIPVTTKAAIDFTGNADNLYVHDCSFDLYTAAANTSTKGVAATTASISADDIVIENCTFTADAAQGNAIDVGDSFRFSIKGNQFRLYDAVTWASAVLVASVTNMCGEVIDNKFYSHWGATYTACITGGSLASTEAVSIANNLFLVRDAAGEKAIEGFGSGDARLAENYLGSIGAGSGGALHLYIT